LNRIGGKGELSRNALAHFYKGWVGERSMENRDSGSQQTRALIFQPLKRRGGEGEGWGGGRESGGGKRKGGEKEGEGEDKP